MMTTVHVFTAHVRSVHSPFCFQPFVALTGLTLCAEGFCATSWPVALLFLTAATVVPGLMLLVSMLCISEQYLSDAVRILFPMYAVLEQAPLV